ncbi:hypothetical protein CY34DRAFT_495689 [Suillus luteus UH-Slu-Lm8-n1]|uniref:Uncharacterized protein n=1 Tax=Suillus luteus UH-Slu-Lm8-n1 TaxID=930992 RepID=A0A0D0AVK2_9AGAM|nr:hypothetical protein CY34DRAFT_495689 [Suillus luteus UH-Slu-Lm8-n1]
MVVDAIFALQYMMISNIHLASTGSHLKVLNARSVMRITHCYNREGRVDFFIHFVCQRPVEIAYIRPSECDKLACDSGRLGSKP